MNGLPQDISDALKSAKLAEFFAECTAAHRNEYLNWIAEAKQPETRRDRIGKAIMMLADRCVKEKKRAKR